MPTATSTQEIDYDALKQIVSKILSSSDEDIKDVYEKLRKTDSSSFGKSDYIPEVLPRVAEQYGKDDPGNLVALLTMNFLVLQKGDSIYVPAE